MPNTRSDAARELAFMLRAPEPGSTNLAAFAVARSGELVPALGVPRAELRELNGFTDEDAAPRLRRWFADAEVRAFEKAQTRRVDRSSHAAIRVGGTARWTECGAVLDVSILLGDLLVDRRRRFIAFTFGTTTVTVKRRTLVQVARVRRTMLDIVAFVDATGLHFRWRGGRGGLNWKARCVPERFRERVLEISLRRPRASCSPRRLGDVLCDVGLF